MADNKKSFVLYADLIHTIKKMPEDKAGKLFVTILEYVNDENPTVDDMVVDLVFEPIKRQLKRDLVKYEDKRKKWSDAGKRSAEVKKAQRTLTNVAKRSTESTVNDTVNVTVNDSIKKEKVFSPPTLKEFMVFVKSELNEQEYISKREKLIRKHKAWELDGWINGRTNKKIKNWKTTILNTVDHL